MTNQEAVEMLTAKAECIRRETSGTDIDCNLRNCDECDLCYKQGTTGDQREALRVAISALQEQDLQPTCNRLATDTISRQSAIDAVLKESQVDGAYGYMDTKSIVDLLNGLPPAQQTLCGYDIEHLMLIADVLRKENLPPERITEALTDIGRIVSMVRDEFEETLRKAVENAGFDKQNEGD